MAYRYAALLAESKACSDRRQNPNFHLRTHAPPLFSHVLRDNSIIPTHGRPNIGNSELPSGSGTLRQMEGAVSSHMLRDDEIAAISGRNQGIRRGDEKFEDPRGNQQFLDSINVCPSSEYGRAPDDVKIHGEVEDRSDSSCWRPELPPSALLDYLRILGSQRLQSDSGPRSENEDQPPNPLANCLSGSALVAVGILIEELTTEFMVSWRKKHFDATKHNKPVDSVDTVYRGISKRKAKRKASVLGTGPLGPVTKRALAIEARLQLKGAKFFPDQDGIEESKDGESNGHASDVASESDLMTNVLLRNRLEEKIIVEDMLYGEIEDEYNGEENNDENNGKENDDENNGKENDDENNGKGNDQNDVEENEDADDE